MSIGRIIVEVNNPEPDRVLSRNGAHRDQATGDDVFLRYQFWNDCKALTTDRRIYRQGRLIETQGLVVWLQSVIRKQLRPIRVPVLDQRLIREPVDARTRIRHW